MGVLSGSERSLDEAEERITELFGPLLRRTGPFPFGHFTSYYAKEMGADILRSFWILARRLERGSLVEAKLATNRIERQMAVRGRRTVNLDPGLLAAESLVMATTKPYAHRVYLAKGVYADLTLLFARDGSANPLPWTYPDYRETFTREFLCRARKEVLLS